MSIPYLKILVPLDGSEFSAQALPHAEEIARGMGAKLILMQIEDPMVRYVVNPTGTALGAADLGRVGVGVSTMMVDDEEQRRAIDEDTADLDRLAASLRHRKIDVEVNVTVGDPATHIVDYADANAVDLIVMSTHGRKGLGRWLYGSVTHKVLQAAPCAVLVVRPTEVKASLMA